MLYSMYYSPLSSVTSLPRGPFKEKKTKNELEDLVIKFVTNIKSTPVQNKHKKLLLFELLPYFCLV